MLKNYFKIAWRNITRHRAYAGINIFGLAIGIAACLLILQYVFNKPDDALGKKIDFWGEQYTIAGVTENFHRQSLRESYEPLILRCIPDVSGYMSVKVNTAQVSQTIGRVKAAWNKFFPGNTFDYFFLDDHFDEQYKADQRFGQGNVIKLRVSS